MAGSDATCAFCGRQLEYAGPHGRHRRFCSPVCVKAARKAQVCSEPDCTRSVMAKGLCPKHYLRQLKHGVTVSVSTCENCGTEFEQAHIGISRFCSRECRRLHYLLEPTVKACAACGKRFSTTKANQRFCSETCLRRTEWGAAGARRKGAPVLETVDPLIVLEAGGWCCAHCGVATPKELRGTFGNDAPEVDHVVAISDGGPHVYSNLQLLCRRCNLEKEWRRKGKVPRSGWRKPDFEPGGGG